jgi:hypothetical protein
MERAAAYGPWQERPKLTVIHDGGGAARYSALPHEIMRDTSLSRDARLLFAVLQGHWWQDGDCFASHATLATEMGCSTRMLRTYLNELIEAGKVTEHEAGQRRQKVYRMGSIGSTVPIEPLNEKPASDSKAGNRKFPTVQSEIIDTSSRKQASDSYKKTPVKKTLEEELPPTGVGVAGATDPPAEKSTGKKSSRGTPCPATFPLEAKHYAYAAEHGYGEVAKVAAITDAFLSHHRFKGTIGKDWYAGWQGWIRRQRVMDDERAARQPVRNGAAQVPPGAASKQKADWRGFKGRYGGNLCPPIPEAKP